MQLVVWVGLSVLEIKGDGRLFFDTDSRVRGMLDDLIWRDWLAGRADSTLGEREVEVGIPEDWVFGEDRREVVARTASARVAVVGFVVSVPGRVETHALTTLAAEPQYKFRTQIRFDHPEGPQRARIVQTEGELDAIMAAPPAVKAQVGRFRLPRIRTFFRDPLDESATPYFYWPPSERVDRTLQERSRAAAEGRMAEPASLTSEYLEGTDLAAAFEPIAERYSRLYLAWRDPEWSEGGGDG